MSSVIARDVEIERDQLEGLNTEKNLLEMLESDRQRMLPQVRDLCEEVDAALSRILEIESDRLPAKYKGKYDTIKFDSLIKKTTPRKKKVQDERETSVTFQKVGGEMVIARAPADRLAAIELYREQVETGKQEIEYVVNDNKQYDAMLAFAKQAVNSGMLTADDFQD